MIQKLRILCVSTIKKLTTQNFLSRKDKRNKRGNTLFTYLSKMDKKLLHGAHTALITPMKDRAVSYADLENLVARQLNSGISGVVPCGTTGESPTLSKETPPGHSGNGCPSGRQDSSHSGNRRKLDQGSHPPDRRGGQGGGGRISTVAPYYNKPSQEGLLAHFGALAERTQKPIVLYSIPSRCGIEISTPTVARLHEKYPHVCSAKEAGGRSSKVSKPHVPSG